jgi:hypothetical protein
LNTFCWDIIILNELNFSFNFTSENWNLERNTNDVGIGSTLSRHEPHWPTMTNLKATQRPIGHFLRVSSKGSFLLDYELTIEVKFEGGVNCWFLATFNLMLNKRSWPWFWGQQVEIGIFILHLHIENGWVGS